MLYLWTLHKKEDISWLANRGRASIAIKKLEDGYRQSFGGDVKLLGGQVVDGPFPREPDFYVVVACQLVCQKNGINFNDKRDMISYSVDILDGIEVGVCKIRINAGSEERTDAEVTPSAASLLLTPSESLAQRSPGLKLDRRAKELYEAAEQGDLERVRVLLHSGAPVNGPVEVQGWVEYPLTGALQHPEIAKLLLDAGANVHACPSIGRTALHFAAQKGHMEVVRLLLKSGAEVYSKKGILGGTPLHMAVGMGCNPDRSEVIRFLLEVGADVNARAMYGRTPLHNASSDGTPEYVNLLLEAGADVNASGDDGCLPIHYAAWRRSAVPDIVRLLVAAGSKLDVADQHGMTPLHYAAMMGHEEIAMILLDAGADANKRTTKKSLHAEFGWTPADCAKHKHGGAKPHPALAKKIRARKWHHLFGFIQSIFSKKEKGGEVKFVRKYSETKKEPLTGATGVLHYEVYKARTAEAARAFLEGKVVSERLHYLVVETPEGNWGRDINGIYRE